MKKTINFFITAVAIGSIAMAPVSIEDDFLYDEDGTIYDIGEPHETMWDCRGGSCIPYSL